MFQLRPAGTRAPDDEVASVTRDHKEFTPETVKESSSLLRRGSPLKAREGSSCRTAQG